MNCTDNSFLVLTGFNFQQLNNFERRCTVKSASGLITEQEVRISDELIPNTGAFSLPARYPLLQNTSYSRILAIVQPKSIHNVGHLPFDRRALEACSEFGSEPERFFGGECFQENVVLLDEGAKLAEVIGFEQTIVAADLAAHG